MVIYFIHPFLSPFYNKMPRIRTAHKFTERQRTGDVLTDEFVDFKSLLLSSDVLKGHEGLDWLARQLMSEFAQ